MELTLGLTLGSQQIAGTYTAPVAAGGIADQEFVVDEAITTLDVAADFTGTGITYALAPSSAALPAGLSLAANGELTGTPTAAASALAIVVRGTNSGGFADTAFTLDVVELSINLNGDGTVDATMSEGTFSFTISGSSVSGYNGTHGPFATADLVNGPINVVAPSISGTAEVGQVLTAVPGLWVWDTADGSISIAAIWQRDDVDLTGETGSTYTTVSGDLGTAIEYQETATDSAGSRVQDSNALTISAAATAPAAFTSGQWTAATGSGASEIDIGITTLPDDGGSAITALEYSVDAGATWAALTGTGTGTRTVDQHSDGTTGTLTVSTSYNVEVRAVNAVGNGADSDTKATTSGAAASGTFADAVLAAIGSKAKVILDATDWDNLKQDTAGTTAVTGTGQNVKYLADLSGNGNHFTASASATPGNALSLAGEIDWNDAGIRIGGTATGLTTGMEIHVLLDPNGGDFWCLAGVNGDGASYSGIAQNGSTSAVDAGFSGTLTHSVDNSDLTTPDRNAVYDTVAAAGGYCVQAVRGIDLSGVTTTLLLLTYSTVAFRFEGNFKTAVVCEGLTVGERSDLFAAFSGV